MAKPAPPAPMPDTLDYALSADGIEVVELAELDLDFVEDAFREGAAQTLEATKTEPANPDDVAKLALFQGLAAEELKTLATLCQSIHAVPGYVLMAKAGRSASGPIALLSKENGHAGDFRVLAKIRIGRGLPGIRPKTPEPEAHYRGTSQPPSRDRAPKIRGFR